LDWREHIGWLSRRDGSGRGGSLRLLLGEYARHIATDMWVVGVQTTDLLPQSGQLRLELFILLVASPEILLVRSETSRIRARAVDVSLQVLDMLDR
jgi:hypothetical protein